MVPERHAMLETLIILGFDAEFSAAFLIRGISNSVKRTCPKWLTPIVMSRPSSVLHDMGQSITPGKCLKVFIQKHFPDKIFLLVFCILPALLMRKSTLEIFALRDATHFRIDLNDAKLQGSKWISAPGLVLRIQLIVFTACQHLKARINFVTVKDVLCGYVCWYLFWVAFGFVPSLGRGTEWRPLPLCSRGPLQSQLQSQHFHPSEQQFSHEDFSCNPCLKRSNVRC